MTTSVQNWSDGEVNEGWVLEDTGSNGVDIRSSEYATVRSAADALRYLLGGVATRRPRTPSRTLATGTLAEDERAADLGRPPKTTEPPGPRPATTSAIRRARSLRGTGPPPESFTVTGLSPTTLYYFSIKTSDEIPNESVISNVPSASTTGDITAPAAVTDLATGTVTVSSIDLSWTAPRRRRSHRNGDHL